MKEHKHKETIIAWANGAEIQGRAPGTQEWRDYPDPAFVEDFEYRVKPKEPPRTYPETLMGITELGKAYNDANCCIRAIANAALRHAIDNGQVITREEFDRAIGDRKARDMAIAQEVRTVAFQTARLFGWDHIKEMDLAIIIEQVKP